MTLFISLLIPTLILVIGSVQDVRTRKITNKLLLIMTGLTLLAVLALSGVTGLKAGLLSAAIALAFFVPLFAAKIVGGGDVKLAAVFALSVDWASMLWSSAYSLVWAAVIGIAYTVIRGHGKQLATNTWMLATLNKPHEKSLNHIPFAVALLFGWLNHVVLTLSRGAL